MGIQTQGFANQAPTVCWVIKTKGRTGASKKQCMKRSSARPLHVIAWSFTEQALAYHVLLMRMNELPWKSVGLSCPPDADERVAVEPCRHPRTLDSLDARLRLLHLNFGSFAAPRLATSANKLAPPSLAPPSSKAPMSCACATPSSCKTTAALKTHAQADWALVCSEPPGQTLVLPAVALAFPELFSEVRKLWAHGTMS